MPQVATGLLTADMATGRSDDGQHIAVRYTGTARYSCIRKTIKPTRSQIMAALEWVMERQAVTDPLL